MGYYIPYARDANGSRDLLWWQQHHPEMVLYKVTNWLSMHELRPNTVALLQCDKKTPAWEFGQTRGHVPLDISSEAVIRWQLHGDDNPASAQAIAQLGYDAISADNFEIGNRWVALHTRVGLDLCMLTS